MAIAIRSRQITLHVADEPDPDHGTVTDPASAVAIASALIADHAHETVIVLMLDSRNRVRGHHVAAVGTLNAARLTGLLGVALVDSLIVTPSGHYSFRSAEGWDDAR